MNNPLESQRRRWAWCGCLGLLLLLGLGQAQQCINQVTVNGRGLPGSPACYFVGYGNDSVAYMQAGLLAQALGAQHGHDSEQRYVLARADQELAIALTDDIAAGLEQRADALQVGQHSQPSSLALQVSDIIYLPIAAVVAAFEGSSSWDGNRQSIHILTSSRLSPDPAPPYTARALPTPEASQVVTPSEPAPPATGDSIPISEKVVVASAQAAASPPQVPTRPPPPSSPTVAAPSPQAPVEIRPQSVRVSPAAPAPVVVTPPTTAVPAVPIVSVAPPASSPAAPLPADTTIYRLGNPRIGIHQDKARVAIDVPPQVPYHIAVAGNLMVIRLPNSEAYTFEYQGQNQYLRRVHYQMIDNVLALVITTNYPMTASGEGYYANTLGDSDGDGRGVLYIDFSPYLRGDSVDILQNYSLRSQQPMSTDTEQNAMGQANLTEQTTAQNTGQSMTGQTTAQNAEQTTTGQTTTGQTTAQDAEASLPAPTPQADAQTVVAEAASPESLEPIEQHVSLPAPAPARRVVVIDPGHGGWDPGAQGYASEEEVVLGIALHLRYILEQQGIEVVLTRSDDTALTEEKRSDLAARAALAGGAERNLFISIHANAAHSAAAHGIETWYFGQPLNPELLQLAIHENGGGELGLSLTEEAQEVADTALTGWLEEEQLRLSKHLARTVQENLVASTGARNRGVRQNAWFVISRAKIPAILVEVGFVSNPEEGRALATDAYQQKLAQGIAAGIREFFGASVVLAENTSP